MNRELRVIDLDTRVLYAGALRWGVPALDAVTQEVLAAARRADSFDRVRALFADPFAIVDPSALGALLSALSTTMVTGDLLGRAHVMQVVRRAKVPVAPIDLAFAGQAAFAEANPLGTLDIAPLPPEEAIALFRDKVPMTRSAFDQLLDAYRGRAFTIAKQETLNAIQIVQDHVQRVLEEGLTLREFLQGLNEAADAGGITAVNPYHAKTVFDTNLQTAYNAGRYEMYHAPEVAEAFPMYEYDSVIDGATTVFCRNMNLYRAPADATIWDTIWPPNHFN
jgi:hypothetical protein